ncbi:MAG: phospho-N-acetylmuramoyl-pentapeptide-transferase [Candidatus Liptonbacteria bacterium]|nr:phospho-N-acetylmuramoyl-pentapeptide-transferase [Candidatus Liptonbacteria bacterium]
MGIEGISFLNEAVRVIILATISFIAALVATPLWLTALGAKRMAKRIRSTLDAPIYNRYHEKKAGTPTAGGVVIWGTVVVLAGFFWLMSALFDGFWDYFNFIDRGQTFLPLAAFIAAAGIGLFDDWIGVRGIGQRGGGLKVRHKLLIYAAIAAVGAWWFFFKLEWTVLNVPFLGNYEIGAWYIPFFMFIIIAAAFSANETDGLDGLFGGVALFAFVALTTVAFVLGRYDLAAFGGAVIGALLAFLWFNIYPARFFMGDTGSMSLGITIGVIAMLTNTTLLLPFFAVILVLESTSVLAQLISKKWFGKKIFRSTPIHHHFEALGWPESQVTMRFWIISAVASALGLVLFFLARGL